MVKDIDICDCDCHSNRGVMHCIPCCYPCPDCGERIENGHMSGHKRRRHTPSEQVKPVNE